MEGTKATQSAANPGVGPLGGRVSLVLLAILVAGALQQAAVWLIDAGSDPFARTPIEDALANWQTARALSGGDWIGAGPYLSAPLYLWLLGLLRFFGLGPGGVYAVQGVLRLATAGLLAMVAARRFSPAVAYLAAGLFLALLEPAAEAGRLLNGTLQLLLVVALWERMLAVRAAPSRGRVVATGVVFGLGVLAQPALLLAVPLLAFWLHRSARSAPQLDAKGYSTRAQAPLSAMATGLLAAAAAIAPATLHNYLAADEIIPVSAQAGITFRHGNADGAVGVYQPIAGVSRDRVQQNRDAFRVAALSSAEPGWNATSSYFFHEGLSWWAAEPAAAVGLLARKALWFAAGVNYGDLYMPTIERDSGLRSGLWLAPLALVWLLPLALVGLAALVRRRRLDALPEILGMAVPLATVLIFFYSPRYRMAVAPFVAVLAAAGILGLLRKSTAPRRRAGLAAALLGGFALPLLHQGLVGMDRKAEFEPDFFQKLGVVRLQEGDALGAAADFHRALELRPDPAYRIGLGEALRRLGRLREAATEQREAARALPGDASAQRSLGVALGELAFGEPDDPERGKWLDQSVAAFRAALALDSEDVLAWEGLGLSYQAQGSWGQAEAAYGSGIEKRPELPGLRLRLIELLVQAGRPQDARVEARKFVTRWPGHPATAALAVRFELPGPPR